MSDLLNELLVSDNADVSAFAKEANDLKNLYESKQISASEYKELLLDLEHGKAITASAGDLETKTKLNEMTSGLINIASVL
jgi:protein involved in sex pheromone biosynthesis